MTALSPLERRLALLTIGGSVGVFLGLLLVLPAFYQTFDEAKYLGIGYNVLTGNGPRTLFGPVFLPHSPLWSAIIAAPTVWFGAEPYAWGRALNALAGVGLILLSAGFGWNVRPIVGGLAAAGYVAVPYLHDLTRTARLDVPAAALALLYVLVGLHAVRRASVGWGIVAGAVFAAAFLVKEIALPFAPVPFLAGIVSGRPWPAVLRVAAATLLVAAIGTSWWFLLYADVTGDVYRLGGPAWLLAPLAAVMLAVVVVGFLAPQISARLRLPTELPRRVSLGLGWGLAGAWFVALTLFFERNPELKGNGLFQPRQYEAYLEAWLPELRLLVAFGIVGVLFGLLGWALGERIRPGTALLALTALCSAPLVLLVIAVGEPPRNYLAQLGILIALAASGWYWAAEVVWRALASRLRLPGSWSPTSIPAPLVALGLAVVFLGASAFLARHAFAFRESASGDARASVVAQTTGWIRANVPAGTPVGFGNFLGHEMSIELRGRNPMVQTGQQLVVADPDAPYGLAAFNQPPVSDFIAVDIAPRRALEFYAYRASVFSRIHESRGTRIYVHTTGTTTSVPSLVASLTPEHGFTPLATFSADVVSRAGLRSTITAHVFAVEPDRIDFTDAPIPFTPDALARLVELLEASPEGAATAASGLVDRMIVAGGTPAEAEALRARLEAIAT